MSRQKSNRTLLIEQERAARMEERKRKREEKERDKAIRKERRERKQAEREAKRTARARRQATHESVMRNGVPKVRSGGTELGIHDAIAYSPLMICEGCNVIVRENFLIDNLCDQCRYGKEVQSEKTIEGVSAVEPKGRAVQPSPEAHEGGRHE